MKNKAIIVIGLFLLSACSINYPCNTWSLVARERVTDDFIFSVCKDLISSYEVEKEKTQLFLEASKILSLIDRKKLNSCSVDRERFDIGHRGSKYIFIVSCAEKIKADGEVYSIYYIGDGIENSLQ